MPLTYYTFASLEGYLVGVNVNGNSRKGDSYSCAVYFSILFEFIIARVQTDIIVFTKTIDICVPMCMYF